MRRAAEGWTVALVDLQDVYDEFGAGDKERLRHPGLRELRARALAGPPRDVLSWATPPSIRRNFPAEGRLRLHATKLIDAAPGGDVLGRLVRRRGRRRAARVGHRRIPARTAAQVQAVVQKTLDYAGRTTSGAAACS